MMELELAVRPMEIHKGAWLGTGRQKGFASLYPQLMEWRNVKTEIG